MKTTTPTQISTLDEASALRALAALAQASRLRIFRALVLKGPDGLAAGDLAAQLQVAPSALSFHLKELSHAGLIEARQDGRFIIYKPCMEEMQGLIAYLTENCCQGSQCC